MKHLLYLFLNEMSNNWLNIIELLHPFPHIPAPNISPCFRGLSQLHVQSQMWAIPSAVAGYNWVVDANVFSDQSVVYYGGEGEADGVLLAQTVLNHPPVTIVKVEQDRGTLSFLPASQAEIIIIYWTSLIIIWIQSFLLIHRNFVWSFLRKWLFKGQRDKSLPRTSKIWGKWKRRKTDVAQSYYKKDLIFTHHTSWLSKPAIYPPAPISL